MASVLLAAVLAAPIAAGTATHGGAVPGAAIVRVTSLADSGPGTLRAAVQTLGPKVIVFDVGGVIHLASDLKMATPQTGQASVTPSLRHGVWAVGAVTGHRRRPPARGRR